MTSLTETEGTGDLNAQLGVRLFTPPPAEFNPLQASDRELLVYGFPSRPDARLQPELAERWNAIMARPMTVVRPEFELLPDIIHGPRRPAADDVASVTGTTTSVNWSGAVCYAASGDTVRSVSAEWTVPNEFADVVNKKTYSSQWIGIDGSGSPDVLQAGTTNKSQIAVGGETFAWWEWYPLLSVKIKTMDVSHGDVMYCLICANSSTTASIYLTNVTTGVTTSFNITAPAGTTLVGNCAEWIVEAPTVDNVQTRVGKFGVVYFDNAFAGTTKNATLNGGKADELFSMVQGGVTLSAPRELGDGVLKLTHQPSPIPVA